MSAQGLAKRVVVAANCVLAASLFMALIWFTVSVGLFVGCLVLYGVAWLVDESAVAVLAVPAARE